MSKKLSVVLALLTISLLSTNAWASSNTVPPYIARLNLNVGQPLSNSEGANSKAISTSDEQNIMAAVEQDPDLSGIETADNYNKALELRDYVYRKTTVGNGQFTYPFTYSEFQNIISGQQVMLCGGIGYFYSALLQLFGVPNRLLELGTTNAMDQVSPNDTHTTVEILDNETNNWVIEDPTFNIEWDVNNTPIGAIQYNQDINAGITPSSSSNQFNDIKSGRSIVGYYLSYSELIEHIAIGAVSIYGPQAGASYYDISYPDEQVWLYPWIATGLGIANSSGSLIEDWNFSSGLPSNWSIDDTNSILYNQNNSLNVITNNSNFLNVLQSNPVNLEPGNYQLVINGVVNSGGMQVALLDSDNNNTISVSYYYSQQFTSAVAGQSIVINFTLPTSSNIEVVLANLAFGAIQSTWTLNQINLTQIA